MSPGQFNPGGGGDSELLASITQQVNTFPTTLCSVDPEEAYLNVYNVRRLNIQTYVTPIKQVETATAAGTVTANPGGNATVTVTALGMTGSPKAVTVALLLNDDANAIATKIRAALAADTNVGAFFDVSGETDKIVLTVKTATDNDASMNIAIAAGTATGVTAAATSANTTAGSYYAIVHPSILYFKDGWNGYKYWMVYTPLDQSNSQWENPSIAVSNDMVTWTTPVGLTNPIEARPSDGGFNADPCIFMSLDNKTMYMVFKYNGAAGYHIYLRKSTDGVNWSDKVPVLTTVGYEEASVRVNWDGLQWRIWTVKGADNPNSLWMRTTDDIESTWPASATQCTFTLPGSADLWHMDICKMGEEYHMIASVVGNTSQHFGVSKDGITWTFASTALATDSGGYYKSTMVPMFTPNGFGYTVFLGRANPAYIAYAELTFDKSVRALKKANGEGTNLMLAKNSIAPWIFCDTFNRADATDGLGNPDVGAAWSKAEGGDMGISGNRAYLPTGGSWTTWTQELGTANFYAEVTLLSVAGVISYLVFRQVDGNNRWLWGNQSQTFSLYKVVAGVQTAVVIMNPKIAIPQAGDRVGVECNGNVIKLYVNGNLIATVTDAANNTGTKIGIRTSQATAYFDNIIAKTL